MLVCVCCALACMQLCPIVCMLVYLYILCLSQLVFGVRVSFMCLTFLVPGCRRQVLLLSCLTFFCNLESMFSGYSFVQLLSFVAAIYLVATFLQLLLVLWLYFCVAIYFFCSCYQFSGYSFVQLLFCSYYQFSGYYFADTITSVAILSVLDRCLQLLWRMEPPKLAMLQKLKRQKYFLWIYILYLVGRW